MERLEVIKSKIHTPDTLKRQIARWRLLSEKIVFTNGCFDILHLGHIDYLAKAADMGTKLVVAVNSDDSVKRLGKGDARPIQDEHSRSTIMAALHVVDAVIIFNEDTPYEMIKLVQPDVLVKGADYDVLETDPSSKKYIAGCDIVRAGGGIVSTIDYLPGYSTSGIEKKIRSC
jgi:D-glycero-beta-D-manno-heptose 1-phosphate adenylyltransferase